jgi:hypothetical protein
MGPQGLAEGQLNNYVMVQPIINIATDNRTGKARWHYLADGPRDGSLIEWPPWPDLPPTVIYLTYPNYYIEPYHYPNPVTGKPMPPPSPRAGGEAFGR